MAFGIQPFKRPKGRTLSAYDSDPSNRSPLLQVSHSKNELLNSSLITLKFHLACPFTSFAISTTRVEAVPSWLALFFTRLESNSKTSASLTANGPPLNPVCQYRFQDEMQSDSNECAKSSYSTGTPFGQVPVLEVDGQVLAQSNTIARYLARKYGLAGKNDWEQALADMYADNINDLLNGTYH